ncbi:ATP-binding protein [Marinobacterium jannaschii]|uniref:ATP-binding protein n=1 Tax=Marinobacterium jannaschii TaxID=64970 RepID=UPI0004894FD9|nr:ATP-binding protein [Marinobacterium jannaschii]
MKRLWPLRSLQGRLLLASLVILPLVMLAAGLALKSAYHNSLESAVQERLQIQVYLLLGAIDLSEEGLSLPPALQEPRFQQLGSGLYGTVHDGSGRLLWRSESTELMPEFILQLDDPAASILPLGEAQFAHLPNQGVYQHRFRVIWELADGEHALTITVMEADGPVLAALKSYTRQLLFWLSVVLLLAMLAQLGIMRWGIQPLIGLADDLKKIKAGETEKLVGQYPLEVQPVTDNLNLLLQSERQQRERYRNTLGDLAHSLKTPLAVIRGAGEEGLGFGQYSHIVNEQVGRMDQIVQYQLARAVKSQGPALRDTVLLRPLVERMLTALGKVYREKDTATELQIDPALGFAGDERDLMELLGNLLENAFKYGHSQVAVSATLRDGLLDIAIEDDGPGVSSEQSQTILQRGARLDTSIQGQGIGLSVAADIVSSYNGALSVERSEKLGGALFRLELPGSVKNG